MSYTRKKRNSYTRSSRQETNRAILPYLIIVLIALFIWAGWMNIYMNNVEKIDINFGMFVLLVIILIAEVPIIIIKSYLAYNNKIVKMRPKSSYSIGNIDDFLHIVEQYRNGNYQYETIKSNEDILESHTKGKMIIFTATLVAEKVMIWTGVFISIFIMIIGTIINVLAGNDIGFTILVLSNIYTFAIVFGGIFFIPNIIKLKRIKRAFFILDPRGIVYRRKWGGVRAYSWKELDLKLYQVQSTLKSFGMTVDMPKSSKFNVILPNGAILEFKPNEYTHKEYFSVEEILQKLRENQNLSKSFRYALSEKVRKGLIGLIALSFIFYFNLGKLDSTEQIEKTYEEVKRKLELGKSQEKIEEKPILKTMERNLLNENQVYAFFIKNIGKAFTANSLFNRINELGVDEQVQSKISLNMIVEILNNLVKKGKINLEHKDSEDFYYH